MATISGNGTYGPIPTQPYVEYIKPQYPTPTVTGQYPSDTYNENIGKPPSLVNIFKEIERDLGIPMAKSGSLTRWAKQGVLMINAIMTVRDAEPGSHKNRGWEIFTDAVITALSEKKNNVVFLLWGTYAQAKGNNIDLDRHLVLKSAHPSPLSVYR